MPSLDILLLRHSYDDHSYIDGKNDTSLTTRGVEIARVASAEIGPMLARKYPTAIDLRVSSKRRAIETADILITELEKHRVEHSVEIDDNLRELYQGNMQNLDLMTHEEKIRILELGWDIFERERIAGNDDYKFGTPDFSDAKYDKFNQFIALPYGESQNELSQRIKQAYVDTLSSAINREAVPLVIAHRGTIREILNITLAHNNGTDDIKQNPSIEMSGWKYCELFTTNILDVEFGLKALRRISSYNG